MKGTRFLKPACWLLCAMMLIGQLTVLASAADGSTGSSTTSSSLADIKEMLNAASYEEYRAKHADAKRATQTVEVDVCGEGAYTVKGDGFKTVEHDGVTGLYTPNTGSSYLDGGGSGGRALRHPDPVLPRGGQNHLHRARAHGQ